MATLTAIHSGSNRRRRLTAPAVLHELEKLHQSLQEGDSFPPRRELLERFDASERIVREALDEFERQGKIVRKVGRGGSVVARQSAAPSTFVAKSTAGSGTEPQGLELHSRTLVVIAEPDGSSFDRALQLLARHPKAAEMAVSCLLMKHEEADNYDWHTPRSKPLGFLLLRNHFEPLARRLMAQGHRVALMGQPSSEQGAGVPNVCGDRTEGYRLVADYLYALGHRRLLVQNLGRHSGVEKVLAEAGFSAWNDSLSDAQITAWASDLGQVRDYFGRTDAPTALVAWNDEQAFRLLSLLNRAGLRVPEDVSLVGYDNLPQGAHMHPALSTVDAALDRQLTAALRLITQEAPPAAHHCVVLMPTLVQRQSSAPPAA